MREMSVTSRFFLASGLAFLAGCGTSVEVPPGNAGLRWEGGMFSGAGLQKDKIYDSGKHYMGWYDDLKQVVCLDSRMEERDMPIVTAGGSKVVVDAYVTFRADCTTTESLYNIVTQVPQLQHSPDTNNTLQITITEPEEIYSRYLRDNLRVAVREAIVEVPLLEVNAKRTAINDWATKRLEEKIAAGGFPVKIVSFNISDMQLPTEIDAKLSSIESIRLGKEEKEAQLRADEEEIDRRKKIAERKKEIVAIESETALLEAQKETLLAVERSKTLQAEQEAYTEIYLKKLRLELDAQIEKAKWEALARAGNVVYLGEGAPTNFIAPIPTYK
jgi:regulator of protease activity HflC (stomatin/prohibitin superfamily)